MCEGQPAQKRARRDTRTAGLGALAVLSDECVIEILQLLPGDCLALVSTVSRALYFLAAHNELWKALVLENLEGEWRFRDSWRTTFALHARPGWRPCPPRRPLAAQGFHSEFVYRSWLCAHLAIDPAWLETENVPRRAGLTREQFREEFEIPNRPVIITDGAKRWPALKKWSRGYLAAQFGDRPVLVGDAPVRFADYCAYADGQADELPLYLFDKHFADSTPDLAADYEVPEVFAEDLFGVLGEARPDYRWLIAGPARSGSTFHQDPNATCAWNAVVAGSKKWVLYPPGAAPPGVRASADGADVASPVSLTEWFLSFYAHRAAGGRAPAECVVRAGEVLFVPRQWWHLALNLEESVAVTQNYVCAANLTHVLRFLACRDPALVSGVEGDAARAGLHDDFLAALKQRDPAALDEAERLQAAAAERARNANKLSSIFQSESAGAPAAAGAGHTPAFKFGFGAG